MKNRLRTLAAGAFFLVAALPLAGCETNPATGRSIFTLGSSIEDDRHIGAQSHPEIVKEFDGVYDDPKVTGYVALVASRIAAASELPNIEWRYTVLNSGDLNAFAAPGGYIYVTRGLMALAGNEAELAGVLAHETGHVTARHSAERQGKATLAQIVGLGASVLAGGDVGNLVSQGGMAYVQHYSQTQEFEADSLGVRYLGRTGYDVSAMASFLVKMREHSRLQNKLLGRPENAVDEGSFLASHPRTIDRVEEATEAAEKATGNGTTLNQEAYLQTIDGLLFGDDEDQGFIRGRHFIHPKLRFRFEAPEGFRMINGPSAVSGIGPGKARFKFDMSPQGYAGSAVDYLRRVWAPNAQLAGLERIEVNGMEGATARVQVRINNEPGEGRLVAIKGAGDRFYRFMFASEPRDAERLAEGFRRLTYSVRALSPQEAAAVRPWRIRLHRVRPGDTVDSLAATMAVSEFKDDWFRVLNGLQPGAQLRPGQLVKVVREG
jgi:predicted Zn-dependent protease